MWHLSAEAPCGLRGRGLDLLAVEHSGSAVVLGVCGVGRTALLGKEGILRDTGGKQWFELHRLCNTKKYC